MAMAEVEMISRHARCRSLDLDDGTVQVEIMADGLEPGNNIHEPKNGVVYFDWLNSLQGFDIRITVEDKREKKDTEFIRVVKRMPGNIIEANSTWHVEKDKVVIKMKKAENISWKEKLQAKGIDIGSSSSEED
ncbi:uncharacterized protein LOC131932007 [Physella acuta]|uniref:uncharacterized protein LOC131932007 n=1 Tax=Physella acuta TaxID=109671 RepID=UPI0027DDA39F|nr:uncharacterized protein LOC131932007 [Physella acuta]